MVRGILTHVALLVLALGTSVLVWTREKTPAVGVGDVQIWNARPVDVERIRFESKGKKVSLMRHGSMNILDLYNLTWVVFR